MPAVQRSSRAFSVPVVVPPPEKESRELSWLTAELKKAGGSWGVGAGSAEGTARSQVEVRRAIENVSWAGVWKTRRTELE